MAIPDFNPLLDAIAAQVSEMEKLGAVCDRILYRDFKPTITPIRGGFEVVTRDATCFRKLEVTQAKGIKAWVGTNPHSFTPDKKDVLPTFGGIEDGLTLVFQQPIDFQQKLRVLSHVWETLIVEANKKDHLAWFNWSLAMGENFASHDNGHVIAFSKRMKSLIKSRQEIGAIAPDNALFMLNRIEEWADNLKVKPPQFLTWDAVEYQGSQYDISYIGFDEIEQQYYYWIKNRNKKLRVLEPELKLVKKSDDNDSCSQIENYQNQQLTLF